MAGIMITLSQYGGRVRCKHHGGGKPGGQRASTFAFDARSAPQQRLRRGCPQADENMRLDHGQLAREPLMTGVYLLCVGTLMDAPLASAAVLEVLDGIGHIHLRTIDPGLRQRTVQQRSCRANKWSARAILPITGLLAYEHDCRGRPLPKYGLGCIFPKGAGLTRCGFAAQTLDLAAWPSFSHQTLMA